MGIRGKMWRVLLESYHCMIMTSNARFNEMLSPDINALQSVRQVRWLI